MKQLFILTLCFCPLLVDAQFSDSTACNEIEKEYNEFERQTTYTTPILRNCSLIKVIDKKSSRYFLSLRAEGNTLNSGEKGVKIILSNKQIISFPYEKIDVDIPTNGSDWRYSAFILLTPDKLNLLKKYKVIKWQLYIYDNEQGEYEAEGFRNMVICIVGLK